MYWSWDFVYFSFIFDDISPGLLAIPFWIPRISMSIGVTIFLVALIDDFFTVWIKEQPSYVKNAIPISSKINKLSARNSIALATPVMHPADQRIENFL